ncbi:MAG: L-threonylcarbamoyladenylate synthase [Candidatus Micrarchaeota archaeon]
MRVIHLENYDEALKQAREALLAGKLIIYPTDTLYGIGANALDEKAVEEVRDAKEREPKPISILVSDLKMLEKHCKISKKTRELLIELLPGPYTFILKAKTKFPSAVTTTGKVGVRVPEYAFMRALVKELNFPITTTSANLSGKSAPSSLEEVEEKVRSVCELAIDGGKCRFSEGSTIVDLTEKEPKVLRKGAGFQELMLLLGVPKDGKAE